MGVVCPPGFACDARGACSPTASLPPTLRPFVPGPAPASLAPAETIVVPASMLPPAAPAARVPSRASMVTPEPESAAPEVPQAHAQPTDAEAVSFRPSQPGSPIGWLVGLFVLGKALAFF